jgi:tetratricopeptide (TPR) repeat protein
MISCSIQFSILLAAQGMRTFVMGAGIGVISLIVYSVRNAGLRKVKNVPDTPVDINNTTDVAALTAFARQCACDGRIDIAIAGFKRVLELDPQSWYAGTMLGNLVFDRDKELSFACLQMLERQIFEEGKQFDDVTLQDFALNYYMLGYHYNRHKNSERAIMFRDIAMKNPSFVTDFKEFRKKFSY